MSLPTWLHLEVVVPADDRPRVEECAAAHDALGAVLAFAENWGAYSIGVERAVWGALGGLGGPGVANEVAGYLAVAVMEEIGMGRVDGPLHLVEAVIALLDAQNPRYAGGDA